MGPRNKNPIIATPTRVMRKLVVRTGLGKREYAKNPRPIARNPKMVARVIISQPNVIELSALTESAR